MQVEVAKMSILKETQSVKAFVDIKINNELIITGFRVIEGSQGLFVGMPREKGRENKWFATVIPITKEVKDEISKAILIAYGKARNENK